MSGTPESPSVGARRRVMVDANVVLDVLLEREVWLVDAARLFAAVAERRVVGVLAAHAVTTVHYVYRRGRTHEVAREKIGKLLALFDVAAVGRAELASALASGFADVEDGVVHAAAVSSSCDGIVTRNGADFSASTLPVYTPGELVAALRLGES